jgi:hypothetical protein
MSVANAVTRKNRLPNPLQRRRVDDPVLILLQRARIPYAIRRCHLLPELAKPTDTKTDPEHRVSPPLA